MPRLAHDKTNETRLLAGLTAKKASELIGFYFARLIPDGTLPPAEAPRVPGLVLIGAALTWRVCQLPARSLALTSVASLLYVSESFLAFPTGSLELPAYPFCPNPRVEFCVCSDANVFIFDPKISVAICVFPFPVVCLDLRPRGRGDRRTYSARRITLTAVVVGPVSRIENAWLADLA
jgi:hypothetical protein